MEKTITEETKAVIFDMDGTLIDSMWIWPDIDDYYIRKYHLTLPEDFHRAIEGKSYHETARYFRDTFDMELTTEEIMEEWTSLAYQRYTQEVTLKPGAEEFFTLWKGAGDSFWYRYQQRTDPCGGRSKGAPDRGVLYFCPDVR